MGMGVGGGAQKTLKSPESPELTWSFVPPPSPWLYHWVYHDSWNPFESAPVGEARPFDLPAGCGCH